MDTLRESHRKSNEKASEIEKLKEANLALREKNANLSKKVELFRVQKRTAEKNAKTLKAKSIRVATALAKLWVDGFTSLSRKELANRIFVDVAYINNEASAYKREMTKYERPINNTIN